MKIISSKWKRKRFELKEKILLDGEVCNYRDLYHIKIKIENGLSGSGEAVILQSHGTESADKLKNTLETKLPKLFNFKLAPKFEDNYSLFSSFSETPAARNALEQAVLNLILKKHNDLENIFHSKIISNIYLNDIIPSLPESETLGLLQKKITQGFEIFKIKTSSKNICQTFNLLNKIQTNFPKIKLRLDPNCNWCFNELNKITNDFEKYNIDYIEQPFSKTDDLIKLQSKTKISIAADESANSVTKIKNLINSGIKTIILKPITVGGILNSIEVINYAKQNNARIIVTSSFESNIGLQIPIITACLLNKNEHHGLNTSHFIVNNPSTVLWKIKGNMLTLNI